MILINILEPGDVITKECWMRPLSLMTMSGGMSDSMSFESQYSGVPENNDKWVRVTDQIGPPWIGRTVEEFNEFIPYEFAIGNIPRSHQLDMKGYSSYRKLHNDNQNT